MSEASRQVPAEIEAALGAVVIHSPFGFSFADEPPIDVYAQPESSNWAQPASNTSVQSSENERLMRAIQATFYNRCYAHRLGEPAAPPPRSHAADPDFVHRLAQANTGREHWDRGWMIHQLGANGQVFVRKGERERAAMPGSFISEAAIGMAPQIGATVSLRAPRESLDAQPGYYFAFGETLEDLADQLNLVRFYFHCAADGAALLLRELTSALNCFQAPFQMKLPATADLYSRTDAAVLYVGLRYFDITARIVAGTREIVPLEPTVPLFTKQLWPGIAVAMDPGTGESFGTHRCRLVAEGIVDAWREEKQDMPGRLAATEARFEAAGLDLRRPWLGPSRIDLLGLPGRPRLP